MEDTQGLYYYTNTDTMRLILTRGDIFATNLKYMNDGEEYVNGLNELRMVLNASFEGKAEITEEDYQAAIEGQPKSYSISFSEERDLLSQWSMYAKESGVSIRMDFSRDKNEKKSLYKIKKNTSSENMDYQQCPFVFPHKVYYLTRHVMEKREYEDVCQRILKDVEENKTIVDVSLLNDIQDGIDSVWRLLAPFVKRKEFFQEAEYRLIFTLNNIVAESSSGADSIQINYRMHHGVLKPYLDIIRDGGWPIKEIMIGPGFNQKAVYDSVTHFLDNARMCIPNYSSEEIIENASFFLRCLDMSNRLGENINLEQKWKEYIEKCSLRTEIAKHFNHFIQEEKREFLGRQTALDNVYMSSKGILLCLSEIPYIF